MRKNKTIEVLLDIIKRMDKLHKDNNMFEKTNYSCGYDNALKDIQEYIENKIEEFGGTQ